jgi:hypothetical protein
MGKIFVNKYTKTTIFIDKKKHEIYECKHCMFIPLSRDINMSLPLLSVLIVGN